MHTFETNLALKGKPAHSMNPSRSQDTSRSLAPLEQAQTASYGPSEPTPTFNPQGYVFTLAGGSGEAGYADGVGAAVRFNDPQASRQT